MNPDLQMFLFDCFAQRLITIYIFNINLLWRTIILQGNYLTDFSVLIIPGLIFVRRRVIEQGKLIICKVLVTDNFAGT